jgi:hypothetical protein
MYLLCFNIFDELSGHNTQKVWILPILGNDEDTIAKQVLVQFTNWKVAITSEAVDILYLESYKLAIRAKIYSFMQMTDQWQARLPT